jgi:predicted aldo/keto reductase-like oxidoreductase
MLDAKEILELLDIYRLFEGASYLILDKLHEVVAFVREEWKTAMVAEYILHYTWHLPGPDTVRMGPKDIKDLREAIGVLSWMAELRILTMNDVPNTILKSLLELFNTAATYGVKRLQTKIIKSLTSIKSEASNSNLHYTADKLDFYLKKMKATENP